MQNKDCNWFTGSVVVHQIQWPDSLQVIEKFSEILQLNVLQIAPVHCLFSGLTLDAFGNMCAIMSINVTVIAFASSLRTA